MKKWIISRVLISLVLLIMITSVVYYTIRSPLKEGEDKAIQYVLKHKVVINIDDVDFYHGSESYQVVKGTDKKGQSWIVWYNEKDDTDITRKEKEGLTLEQVRNVASKKLNPVKINDIRLGVENNLPVYEISYIDEEQRYAYYYITFDDGMFVKRYSLKKQG